MNNAAKLARRKYRKTDLSEWTFSKKESKAFSAEMTVVGDATEIAMDRCLEDYVPEYNFYFYYWVNKPTDASFRELLKRLNIDDDTEPKLMKVYDNPDYTVC
jgi:hypothetical protein